MGRRVLELMPLALLGMALGTVPGEAAVPAQPGSVNYVEGKVLVAGRPVTQRDLGNATVPEGGIVATEHGKVEVLLTPGVVLRLGDNSQARLNSESLTDTRVSLLAGQAMIEADQLYPENHIVIAQGNGTTTLRKAGLYRFDAAGTAMSVLKGEATVNLDGRNIKVKSDHQLIFADARLKPHKFGRAEHDELYAWSQLRSDYSAQASEQTAAVLIPGGPGWFGTGWYWDPAFDMYAFVPGDGFFYGPFGYPFYSPYYALYWGGGPWFYGGGGRWHGGRYYHGSPAHVAHGPFRGGNVARGFHKGAAPHFGGGMGFHGGGRR